MNPPAAAQVATSGTASTFSVPRRDLAEAPAMSSTDLPTSTVSAQTNSQSTVRRPAVDSTPDQTSSADTVTRSPARDDVSGQTTSVTSQEIPAASRAPEESSVEETPADTVRTVLAAVGLGPLATPGPESPVEPPGSWIVAAWARREYEQQVKEEAPINATDPVFTSLALDSAEADQQTFAMAATTAETNSPPEVLDPFSRPDLATGTVIGTVDATDPDGDPLSYAVTAAPTSGTVTVDAATGAYTYTPNDAARLQAAQTSTRDTDTFIVTVSDGQASTPVTVTLPLSPAQLAWNSSDDINTATSPTGVATSPDGKYTYVANQGSNTVSVLDNDPTSATYNTIVKTITVGSSPTGVAVSPDGRMYVANTGSGTVSVIDTNTGQLIDTNTGTPTTFDSITVGTSPSALLLDGNRLYVANTGSNSVSVIDTTTYKLIDTNPSLSGTQSISVGSSPSALALGPGGRLYVANTGSNTVSVIDTTTSNYTLIDANPKLKGTQSISVGTSPSALALGADGRLYVANRGSSSVSVIDTNAGSVNYNKVIKTITVGANPNSVAVSPDGSLAYVANANDTVSVIDTRTNAVVRTITINSVAGNPDTHYVSVSPDGNRIYVTDTFDKKLRIISMTGIFENATPQVSGAPTVGTPDETAGAVTGKVNFAPDADGDPLTYTVTDPPEGGTVTVDAAGNYTYTPTSAAREAAYNSARDPDTDTFTVTVSDGYAITNVSVTVPISPAPPPPPPSDLTVTTTPIPVGANPTGVAVIGPTGPNDSTPHQAYVVNSGDGTVSVIDTDPSSATYNHVITTIAVGYYPTRVAASPEGDRVYVGNYDTVSVIDTTSNEVIATIPVPSDGCGQGCYNGVWDVAVSLPDGDVLYAAVGDGTVSKIDTNTYEVISTTPVGFWDGDMEVRRPDGSRLYAADGVSDTVVVYDTATMQRVATVDVGPGPVDVAHNVAVSRDGTRAYVTEEVRVVEPASGGDSSRWLIRDAQGNTWVVTDTYSAVSVIDTDPASGTYNKTIATITVPDGAQDVAVSADGSRAYVTHSDGKTVTVIDTTTNQVIGTLTTDQNSTVGSQYITVGPDGRLYITDQADGTTYAVTVGDATAL